MSPADGSTVQLIWMNLISDLDQTCTASPEEEEEPGPKFQHSSRPLCALSANPRPSSTVRHTLIAPKLLALNQSAASPAAYVTEQPVPSSGGELHFLIRFCAKMEAGLSPWVDAPSWLRFRCWHAINPETGWSWTRLIPTGPFSRWLLCTSEVRKDELFRLHCPGELRGEGAVCVCRCAPVLLRRRPLGSTSLSRRRETSSPSRLAGGTTGAGGWVWGGRFVCFAARRCVKKKKKIRFY